MCLRCCLVAAMMVVVLGSPAGAGQSRIIGDPERDVRQTMQARKLLADDPELASLNIGVTVSDRVAVLWGPVPSAEAAFRAELCLKTMVELAEVHNELFVNDSFEPMRGPLKIDSPPQFLPDLLPPRLPEQPRPILGAPGHLTGQDKAKAKGPSGPIKVLSPAPVTEKLRVGAVEKKPDPPSTTAESDRELAAAIKIVLQSKSTYSAVQFAVEGGRVYLRATNQDSNVLHESARAISRLPKVSGVILLDKAVSP